VEPRSPDASCFVATARDVRRSFDQTQQGGHATRRARRRRQQQHRGLQPARARARQWCADRSRAVRDSGKNVYTLITMAYFGGGNLVQGCLYASFLGLLYGGPGWIQSDAYDIQAVIPAGSFSSTPTIRDPKLQRMLQSLMADRFKLVLSREMKEMPVYIMTLKEPAKYAASKDTSVWLTKPIAEQDPQAAHIWAYLENRQGLVAQEDTRIYGANATMLELATLLGRLMGQPVLDRTGFTSKINFSLERPSGTSATWLVPYPLRGTPSRSSPSLPSSRGRRESNSNFQKRKSKF